MITTPTVTKIQQPTGGAPAKLGETCGCKFRPAKAIAGKPEPSLVGVAVTRGPKRRQESCRVCEYCPEKLNGVEAEAFPVVEGTMCTVAMRDGDAPPGTWTTSCTEGLSWKLGEPTGSIDEVVDGGTARGVTEALRRAEVGSRTGS